MEDVQEAISAQPSVVSEQPATRHLTPAPPALLPLEGERAVTFEHKGWPYTYRFRRIRQTDWERYFKGIHVTRQRDGKNAEITIADPHSAAMDLVANCLVDVEGYRGEFRAKPEWKSLLPPGHMKAAANLLCQVEESGLALDRPLDPDFTEVALTAAWGAGAKPGQMLHYSGLIHRFRTPTAEHRKKHNRGMAQARTVGGSRTGMTVYVGKQGMLVSFYDELILNVEGYSVSGRALATEEEIRQEMDAFHKVLAVSALFEEPEIDDAPAVEAIA